MTLAEAQTRVALVRTAINNAIANGGTTSYMIKGRSATKDLNWLYAQERDLDAFIARATTGGFSAVQFRRPE